MAEISSKIIIDYTKSKPTYFHLPNVNVRRAIQCKQEGQQQQRKETQGACKTEKWKKGKATQKGQ